jgi:hypothetical protein
MEIGFIVKYINYLYMSINFDYQLYNDLTVILSSGIKYIQVMGVNAKVSGNVIVVTSGAQAQVSVALESPSYVLASGLSDTDLTWTDFQSPTSASIATISGTLLNTQVNAPNIIKIKSVVSGKSIKFNFRGNRA